MKKIRKSVFIAFVITMAFAPNTINANTLPVNKNLPPVENSVEASRAKVLLDRLNEIKLKANNKLNVNEKKALREETKSIKKELKQISGGVYISAGTIIIILLLILIFL
ncbi:MAG TPA: hypothetical protein VK590_08185 [Saprospiraceae bacterium]|nr:hypothetical protein [Saprospiraceae bacterium]